MVPPAEVVLRLTCAEEEILSVLIKTALNFNKNHKNTYSSCCLGHAVTGCSRLTPGCKRGLLRKKTKTLVVEKAYLELVLFYFVELVFTVFHCYLLHSSQVVELCTADLLLQHELLEVLSCIRLSLQCLKSLDSHTHDQSNSSLSVL